VRQRRPEASTGQRGAAALLTVTVLVVLASAGAALAARSLWLDRLSADSRLQAQQARLAAESALAQAAAVLQQVAQQQRLSSFWSTASGAQCPATHPPPAWQCLQQRWQQASGDGRPAWQLQATYARHLTRSPHVVQVLASASRADASTRASLSHSLYQPALLPLPLQAPGAVLPVPQAWITPPDCALPAWQAVLGPQTEDALRLASESQASAGLHGGSTPARTVYWVDSPLDWPQSLGRPTAPVLLVFSRQACAQRCPRLGSNVEIHGTVVLDAGCERQRLQGWSAGRVYGQVVASAPIDGLSTTGTITAAAYAHDALRMRWPLGIDAREVQWVAGGWSLNPP